MRLGRGRLAAVAAMALVAVWGGAWAQAPSDACALLSRDEFQALTGKTEYTDPTGMPWSGGTVCGFGNGQIILLLQADSAAVMDRFLATAAKDLVSPRTPVDGLGDGAFSAMDRSGLPGKVAVNTARAAEFGHCGASCMARQTV